MQSHQKEPPSIFIKTLSTGPQQGTTPIRFDEIFQHATLRLLKTQNLISILSRSNPLTRTQKQCKMIADLLKNEPYFASISRNLRILIEISHWIQYLKVDEGQYIYKVKDVIDSFYILLKGQVHLTAPEKIVYEEDEQQQSKQEQEQDLTITANFLVTSLLSMPAAPALAKRSATQIQKPTAPHQTTPQQKKTTSVDSILEMMHKEGGKTPQNQKETKPEYEERMVRLVVAGQSFGDLVQKYHRITNAIAKEPTHLLIIRKQYYQIIQQIQLKSQGKKKFQFLYSLPFFKLLYRYSLQALILQSSQKGQVYNQTVYRQNDRLTHIYVVYSGQFKLFRKIVSKKNTTPRQQQFQPQTTFYPQKMAPYKTVYPGQILGYLQAFNNYPTYSQSCVCKSQEGIVLCFQKNKFLKKVRSTDNNVEEILTFVDKYTQKKTKEVENFLNHQQKNNFFIKYLHTPTKKRRTKTQASFSQQSIRRTEHLRTLSTSSNNFFNKMNVNVTHQTNIKRISLNRRNRHLQKSRQEIPSSIKDIVEMVSHQKNYHNIRGTRQKITLYDVNIQKVPLHVKKKYSFLYKDKKAVKT